MAMFGLERQARRASAGLRSIAKRAKGPLPSPAELAALHERAVLKDVAAF